MPEYSDMTNMKRSLSDSENDDFDDESMKGASSPSDGTHGPDRKKRRGIIEKRRRDRINGSLSELRRLVPQAFEKQGSAKLEKAEILQMTVDHLKTLHSKGLNGYNLDTAALAMDYRSVGFRECAAEVARYLVTCEGMDIQDPLRLRLMSHLQCYSAQREAAAKASLQTTFQSGSWNHMASHHGLNSQYNSTPVGTMAPPPPPSMLSQHAGQTDQLGMTSHATGLTTVSYSDTSRLSQHSVENSHVGHGMSSMRIPSAGNMAPQMSSVSSSSSSQVTPQVLSGLSQMHAHSQFPVSLPMLSPNGTHYSGGSSMKPYRPWGAELAY